MVKKIHREPYKAVLTDLMRNGYTHIKAINNEIHSLNIKNPEEATPEMQEKLKVLTLTLTLINDLLHPAHRISKKILKKSELPLIDYCIKAQKVALENKLVDECFCISCREEKDEAKKSEDSQD